MTANEKETRKKILMIKDWTLRTEKTEKVIVVSATSKIEIKSEVSYEKWQTRVYVSRFKCLPMVSLVQARLMSTYLPILLSEDRTKLSYIDRNENTRVFQIEWRYWRVSGCWQFYLTEFNKESFPSLENLNDEWLSDFIEIAKSELQQQADKKNEHLNKLKEIR